MVLKDYVIQPEGSKQVKKRVHILFTTIYLFGR